MRKSMYMLFGFALWLTQMPQSLAQSEFPCAQPWGNEFLRQFLGESTCVDAFDFLPNQQPADSLTHQLFIPPSWRFNRPAGYLETTILARNRAIDYFNEYAFEHGLEPLGPTVIVFAEDSIGTLGRISHTAETGVWENLSAGDPCPIILGTDALERFSMEKLEFVIAHECGHCFQQNNGWRKSTDSINWWDEGLADFYANAIYPSLNLEQVHYAEYNPGKTPYSYVGSDSKSTGVLLEAIKNYGADTAVLQLIQSVLDSTDATSMQNGLAGFFTRNSWWHTFAQDLVDRGISDPGGGRITHGKVPIITKQVGVDSATTTLSGKINPFEIRKWDLTFPAGYRYRITTSTDSNRIRMTSRPRNSGRWSEGFPPSITTGCLQDVTYEILPTNIGKAGDPLPNLSLDIHSIPQEECTLDLECLQGTWQMDPSSATTSFFVNHFNGLVNDSLGVSYTNPTSSSNVILTIDSLGNVGLQVIEFTLRESAGVDAAQSIALSSRISGMGEGRFRIANRPGFASYEETNTTYQLEHRVKRGDSDPETIFQDTYPFLPYQNYRLQCSGSTLRMQWTEPGVAVPREIRFSRQ
jgi:hypothetical protein